MAKLDTVCRTTSALGRVATSSVDALVVDAHLRLDADYAGSKDQLCCVLVRCRCFVVWIDENEVYISWSRFYGWIELSVNEADIVQFFGQSLILGTIELKNSDAIGPENLVAATIVNYGCQHGSSLIKSLILTPMLLAQAPRSVMPFAFRSMMDLMMQVSQ